MSWIKLTSVTATNGSKIVVVNSGSTTGIKAGDALKLGAFDVYEIEGVFAAQIQLREPWGNATQNNAAAVVVPTFGDFNAAVEAMRSLTEIAVSNLTALEQWGTQTGTVNFQGQDGETHTARTLLQMDADVQEKTDAVQQATDEMTDLIGAQVALMQPDVYIPFNDSLQIVRGYGTHDKIDVSPAQDGSVMVELPTKSVDFSRSSNRTYFNKSGELVTASIDEPRFSRDGLIIEKSVTNFIGQVKAQANGINTTYSDSVVPFLDTTFSIYTIEDVTGESYKDLQQVTANNFNDGEVWTFSVFFNLAETTTESISLRLAYGMAGTVKYNIATNTITQGSLLGSFERHGNILRLSITDAYSTHTNGVLCRVQAYDREVGDTFSMCGGQLEKGAVASSYIKPSGSVVTAGSDFITLPIRNNMPPPGESFSISVLANVPDGVHALFGFGLGTAKERLTLWRFGTGRKVAFRLADAVSAIAAESGNLDDYGEHRFTSVYNADDKTISLYVDGELGGTSDASNINWTETYNLSDSGNLGKCRSSGSNEASLDAAFSEFKIYHYALTAAQVKAGG